MAKSQVKRKPVSAKRQREEAGRKKISVADRLRSYARARDEIEYGFVERL